MEIVVKDLREHDAFGRRLEVEVAAGELDSRLDAAIADLRRGLALPGFRKGKVPRSVVESRFGGELRSEVVHRLVEEAVWQAMREADLQPIAEPEVEGINYGDGGPLSFTARVDVRPALEIGDPAGVRVDKVVHQVEDGDVERVLTSVRESLASFAVVDRPAALGDVLTADLTELGQGQVPLIGSPRRDGIRLELSEDELPPPWLHALIGKRPGDSVVLEIPPAREGELPPPGAPRYHRLHVKQVESKTLPPLDSTLAEQVGAGQVTTLEELKAQIRIRLEADEERRARETVERDVLDRLGGGIRFEIPDRIARPLADRMFARAIAALPDLGPEERERLAVESRQAAQAVVRRELVIAAVAQAQGIEISEEEAAAELRRLERRSERAGEPRAGATGVDRAARLEHVREALIERKVLKYLVDKADVQVVPASAKRKRIVTPYDP